MSFSFRKRSPSQALRSKAEVQREHRRTRYGVSTARFADMLALQNERCALCFIEFSSSNLVAIDHDHETKKVRGLLCKACNTLLGRAADDVEWLRRAADYVETRR